MALRAHFTRRANESCARNNWLIAQAVTGGITEYSLTNTPSSHSDAANISCGLPLRLSFILPGGLLPHSATNASKRDEQSDWLFTSAFTSGMTEYLATDPISVSNDLLLQLGLTFAILGCYWLHAIVPHADLAFQSQRCDEQQPQFHASVEPSLAQWLYLHIFAGRANKSYGKRLAQCRGCY